MRLLSTSARDLVRLGEAEFRAKWRGLTEDQQEVVRAEALRIARLAEYHTPGELAVALDPSTVQTPALTLVDEHLVKVGWAVSCMYERRARRLELLNAGVDDKVAIEQVAEEIPSRGISRLIMSLPFQEGKSTRVNRYGLEWLLRQFLGLRITLISYDGVNANRISHDVRSDIELFDGTGGRIDLGLRLMPDQKAMGRWVLTSGGGVYAIGVGGGLTGHPSDLGSIDDPLKDLKAAESVLQARQQINWYQTTFRPRLAPWAPVVITTTRWADNDLVGQLTTKRDEAIAAGAKNYDDWVVINIPAQADYDPRAGESDILGRRPGEFMLSARGRTQADWETTKNETPPHRWRCVYQGDPTPGTGTILLKAWWRRYDEPLWSQQFDGSFRVPGYQLVQHWDFTFKKTTDSDYVAGQVWALKGADAFLVYQLRAQLNFTDTLDAIRRVTRLFPEAARKYYEDTANGPAIGSALKHEIPGLMPVSVKDSKTARAEAATPFLIAGNIHVPTTRVATMNREIGFDVEGFIDEATAFPLGTHDDQVDAFTQMVKKAFLEHSQSRVTSPAGRAPGDRAPKAEQTVMAKRIAARAKGA